MKTKPTKEEKTVGKWVWVSVLIPAQGADLYDGARVMVCDSQKECYQDLSEWMDLEWDGINSTIDELNLRIGDSDEIAPGHRITMWKVEKFWV